MDIYDFCYGEDPHLVEVLCSEANVSFDRDGLLLIRRGGYIIKKSPGWESQE
jgi:hypothetical protein